MLELCQVETLVQVWYETTKSLVASIHTSSLVTKMIWVSRSWAFMPTNNEIISLENDVIGHSSKDCNTIKSYSSLLQQLYLDSFSLDRELILLTVSRGCFDCINRHLVIQWL